MRKSSYWKFGGGYSYRTPRSKKTQWTKHLKDVPVTARGRKMSKPATTKKKSLATSPSKRRKKNVAKKKSTRRGGFKLPGGVGPKAVIMGALGLMLVPRIIPVQSPGAVKLATGLGMRALKIGGGGPLSAVGLMELAAQYGGALVGGAGLPFLGGPGGNGPVQTGYDY